MFERFTERARRVVVLAQEEARMLDHNYIGTEHILLGLIREGHGVGAQILELLAGPLSAVRETAVGLAGSEPQESDQDEPTATVTATSSSFGLPRGRGPERDTRMGERDAWMRMMVETVVEFREAIASIRRRLAAIEHHLGIDGEQAKSEAAETAAPEDPPLA
jgi:ATP-dependent Clp protease ATP-binding subunit ClpA